MNNLTILAGSADVSVIIRIIDSADGTPETGVVYNTAGIDLEYRREGAVSTAITEATLASLSTAHADGGFLHIGNGYYRLDLPDAAVAAGAAGVLVHGTVTGMVVIGCYIQLVAYNPNDAVRLGLTALPNAAAEAAGGLYTRGTGAGQINQPSNGLINANTTQVGGTAQTARDLGASVLLSPGTGTGQISLSSGAVTTGTNNDKTGYALSAAGVQAIWDALSSALTTAGSIGKRLVDYITGDIYARIGAPAGASVSADIAAIEAQTDDIGAAGAGLTALGDTRIANLDATVSSRAAGSILSGITSLAEWLGLLAGKQTGNTTARTELRATGAGSGTFDETTDSQEALRDRGDAAWITATGFSTLDAVGVRSAVGLASANLDTQLAAIDDAVDTEVAAILTAVDTEVAAIKAKTDNLPASPAAVGDIPTAAAIADQVWDEAISGHLGAGSTGAALNAAGSAGDPWSTPLPGAYGAGTAGKIIGDNINAPIATVDTVVDAIKAKTDNLPASPASTGDIPSAAAVADQVWDETLSGHLGAGSTGNALNAAGSAGDPWATAIPGAYGAGTAGKILGDNINAAISSRSSHSAADVWSSVTRTLTSISDSGGITTLLTRIIGTLATGTHNPQSGDAFARLGAPAGASVSADVAAVQADMNDIQTRLPAALVSGRIDASVGAYQTGLTPLQPTTAGRTLDVTATGEAGIDLDNTSGTLAKGTEITGFNDLDVAGVRTAVGLASANLDTQLDALPTANENADALLDRANGIETGYTPRQSIRLMFSALAAKLSGAATTTVTIRDVGDTKDRITATVDADGNRTAVTLDGT